jgi:hypothetical protein
MNLWDFLHKKHLYTSKPYVPGQNLTKFEQYEEPWPPHKTEITHENRDHTQEIFKYEFCKSGSVLIHVAYNIRSLVAAQPLFLGLTYFGASKSISCHTNLVEYFKSPCYYVIKFGLGKHMIFGELEPKTYPPRTKGLEILN